MPEWIVHTLHHCVFYSIYFSFIWQWAVWTFHSLTMTTAVRIVGFMSQPVVQIIDFSLLFYLNNQTDGSLSSNIPSLATDLWVLTGVWTHSNKNHHHIEHFVLNEIKYWFFFSLFLFFHVAPLLPTTLVLTLSGKRHSGCNFMLLLPWMLTVVHLLNPGQLCLRCVRIFLAFLGSPEHRGPNRILNTVSGSCNCSVGFIFITLWPLNFLQSWTAWTFLSKTLRFP